jgi:hypothetical protein
MGTSESLSLKNWSEPYSTWPPRTLFRPGLTAYLHRGTGQGVEVSKSLVMRIIFTTMAVFLGACASIQRDKSQMTPEQLLQKSTHVFIGVIEELDAPTRTSSPGRK